MPAPPGAKQLSMRQSALECDSEVVLLSYVLPPPGAKLLPLGVTQPIVNLEDIMQSEVRQSHKDKYQMYLHKIL